MRRLAISCISCVLLLAGMASADVQWFATDVSAESDEAVQTVHTVLIEVEGTTSHQIQNYYVSLDLVPIDVSAGSVSFGTPAPAPTDYLFPSSFLFTPSAATSVKIVCSDDDNGDSPTIGPGVRKSVIEVPILVAAGTEGKWEVRFNREDEACTLDDTNWQHFPNAGFEDGTIDIIPEPTTIGLLAFSGLMLIRRKRR